MRDSRQVKSRRNTLKDISRLDVACQGRGVSGKIENIKKYGTYISSHEHA